MIPVIPVRVIVIPMRVTVVPVTVIPVRVAVIVIVFPVRVIVIVIVIPVRVGVIPVRVTMIAVRVGVILVVPVRVIMRAPRPVLVTMSSIARRGWRIGVARRPLPLFGDRSFVCDLLLFHAHGDATSPFATPLQRVSGARRSSPAVQSSTSSSATLHVEVASTLEVSSSRSIAMM